MTDPFPTLLSITPHTQAKHTILRLYLEAWIAILSRQSTKIGNSRDGILFVDGFAGPGVYEGGEPGSPVIAIDVVLNHSATLSVPIRMLFIEERGDRHQSLEKEIYARKSAIDADNSLFVDRPICGECATELGKVLDKCEKKGEKFGPALVFLDQFGYSQVPMDLIERILQHPQCEVFSYLNYKRLSQFIGDVDKQKGISRAWGSESWREALELVGGAKRNFLKESYKQELRDGAGAKFVLDFAMCGQDGTILYWLFFCTNNLRGIEEMKRAMWKLDDSGAFRFSDRDDPDQLRLLSGCTQEWLAGELEYHLRGREMLVQEIKEFVLTDTPCYLFKQALKILEREDRIVVMDSPVGRRSGTFPSNDIRIRFSS